MSALPVSAQNADKNALQRPDFTAQSLAAQKQALAGRTDLPDEQAARASDYYDTAISALDNARRNLAEIENLQQVMEGGAGMIEGLQAEIDKTQAQLSSAQDEKPADLTEDALSKLESDLLTRENDMRSLTAELQRYDTELQALTQRSIHDELTASRAQLNQISQDMISLSRKPGNETELARQDALIARQYDTRTHIARLELEISSQPIRQQILSLRRDLAALQVGLAERDVIQLQDVTGKRRVTEARTIIDDAVRALSLTEKAHPFVQSFAADNLIMAHQLTDIAQKESVYPRLEADVRSRRDEIRDALSVAEQLTDLGRINNRQASDMLRRLRTQRPSLNNIRSEIQRNRRVMVTATQTRLWAQDELRQLPPGKADLDVLMRDWLKAHPDQAYMDASSRAGAEALYQGRRVLVRDISDAAFALTSDGNNLQTLLNEYYDSAESLSTLLNQKMLWLPSMKPISFQWPEIVLRGSLKAFGPERMSKFMSVLTYQIRSSWYVTLFFALFIALALYVRPRLRREIREIAGEVGKVQKDSFWHTPYTILATLFYVSPVPLLFLLIAILFNQSDALDPIVSAASTTNFFLAQYSLFLLVWSEWNRENSLFDAHFDVPQLLRKNTAMQIKWFLPYSSIIIGVILLTQSSHDPDVYEGVSVLAFILFALTFAYFAYRVIWKSFPRFQDQAYRETLLWRYRKILTATFIVLPCITAILAMSGYYYTAGELTLSIYATCRLLILTFVIYGLGRRTLVVAQRRLTLNRAIERREKILKARHDKESAQERGVAAPPPPVDYDQIDVETISRQSAQLLKTLVFIGFALALAVTWSNMVPALANFDTISLWSHTVSGAQGDVTERITLWNVIQSLAILFLTFIGVRNLPGFLEVFFLNRTKFDGGTRYAVTNIIGYIIMAIGVVVALDRLGLNWSQMQWVVASLGVGIGFGLQEIIANFFSGLVILFERPVRVGDYVTVGDQSGTVTRIQLRATTLIDLDNREILIPNKALITERVVNWTLSNAVTRQVLHIGIAYGSDTDKARDIIFGVVRANSKVLKDPAPQVLFLGFGDSSLEFEIRVFLDSFDERIRVQDELNTALNKALAKAGISIPFPQRDLHIISTEQINPAAS